MLLKLFEKEAPIERALSAAPVVAGVIPFHRETGYLFFTQRGVKLSARGIQLVFGTWIMAANSPLEHLMIHVSDEEAEAIMKGSSDEETDTTTKGRK